MQKKAAPFSYEKFTQKEWLMMEQELPTMQLKVCSAMKCLGQNDYAQQAKTIYQEKNKYLICGDTLYISDIQPVLKKQFPWIFDETKEEEKKQIKGKKEKKGKEKGKKEKKGKNQVYEKFLKSQVNEKIKSELNQLITNIEEKQINSFFFGFNNLYLEIKLSTFFFISNSLLGQNTINNEDKEKIIEQLYELVIAIQKTVQIYKNYSGPYADQQSKIKKNNISPILIQDLEYLINLLKKAISFNISTLAIQYPKLQIFTTYDQFFPILDIKPYSSQVQFIECLRNLEKTNNPYMMFYKTMIATGKTSVTMALASFALNISTLKQMHPPLQVIFCCGVEPVRHQIGQMAYNSQINFGILGDFWAKDNSRKVLRVINNFRCKNDLFPTLLISDPASTYILLKRIKSGLPFQKGRENANVIVFLDEPILGHISTQAEQIGLLKNIIKIAPNRLILCSSTIPSPEELPHLVSTWKEATNCQLENQVQTIYSTEFQLGCQIFSFEGVKFYPHHICKNKEDLEKLIGKIKLNAFFHRLYPLSSLYELHRTMASKMIQNLPDLYSLSDITQDTVKKVTFQMLETLGGQQEDIIQAVCTSETSSQRFFNYEGLCTTDSYKFQGGCLIVTTNPLEFVKKYFIEYTKDCMTLNQMQKIVESKQKLKEKEEKGILENVHKEEELARALTDLDAKYSEKYQFDEKKQINTKLHFKTYHGKQEQFKFIRQPLFEVEMLINELSGKVSEEILQLLLCGVGIYAKETTSEITEEYIKSCLKLASLGRLAYLICDDSLTYGMNFPINNLILTEDMVCQLSMNALFQLMGRVGRVGVSYLANIFFPEAAINRIKINLKNIDKDQEAIQIDQFFI